MSPHGGGKTILFAALFASMGCADSTLACGPGTERVGDLCVVSSRGDGGADTASQDASAGADVGVDRAGDRDVTDVGAPRAGDPCVADSDACEGARILACGRIPGPNMGRLVATGIDCALLGGRCVVASGNASCAGGAHALCDRSVDRARCHSPTVLAECNGAWVGVDCGASGRVCRPTATGARCEVP